MKNNSRQPAFEALLHRSALPASLVTIALFGSTVACSSGGDGTKGNTGGTSSVAATGTGGATTPDGVTTMIPPVGTTEPDPTAGSGGQMGMGTDPEEPDASPIWINEKGKVVASTNTFGIQGDWYAFGDKVTSEASGNPYVDGKYCVSGVSTGEADNWGVGMGLDLNSSGGEKMPYEITGKLSGFRMKVTGSIPAPARLNFVTDLDVDVNPFILLNPSDENVYYSIQNAQVPFSWGVDNAGQRVDGGVVYSLQLLAPGDSEAGPIDLCIEQFEAVYDATEPPRPEGGPFINPDGFVKNAENTYGVEGPVYVIGDGVSTTQVGVPFSDGKYCVAGTFSGAADDWGAGIALDLNNVPGVDKGAFAPSGKVAGFRVGLSGSTPGGVRVQFIINEPQEGNQPFLVGLMNTSAIYPIDWAQVPASWEVDDAGLEVEDSIYTMQLYLDGTDPGPFEVCIEELAPLAEAEMTYAAPAAGAEYYGFQTVDPAILPGEYELWKSRHFNDCGDGSACIPRADGDCISEGIGYGMLITVGNDDQESFDKLWAYFNKHKRASGMMDWRTTPCGGVIDDGAATDGDVDAAMALVQASCKWGGSYESDAVTLMNAISTSAVANCGDGSVLMPGDDFGGCTDTNPSYIAPGYFKVFREMTGNTVWDSLTDKGYDLLAGNQANYGGMFSDWSDDIGGASQGVTHTDPEEYGPDASRVPWRLATDYVWNGEARAATLLDAFRAEVDAGGGVHRMFTPNSNFRGGSAFSAIHTDAAMADEYTQAWLLTSVDDASYFPGTLRLVYMLLAANQFPSSCN